MSVYPLLPQMCHIVLTSNHFCYLPLDFSQLAFQFFQTWASHGPQDACSDLQWITVDTEQYNVIKQWLKHFIVDCF